MGFVGTTAAVALGSALAPLVSFVLRVFGLLLIVAFLLYSCGGDDGERFRCPSRHYAPACVEKSWYPQLAPGQLPQWITEGEDTPSLMAQAVQSWMIRGEERE